MFVLERFSNALLFSSFQLSRSMCTEVEGGALGQSSDGGAGVADPGLVSPSTTAVGGLSIVAAKEAGSSDLTGHQGLTSTKGLDALNGLQIVREAFRGEGISERAVELIMASWRPGTQRQYGAYVRQWVRFCSVRDTAPLSPPISVVLDFLSDMFDNGKSYSTINTARSALSAILPPREAAAIGASPLVVRLMSGIYNLRPAQARYVDIWDVRPVLNLLRK